jgi:hypothetical protein
MRRAAASRKAAALRKALTVRRMLAVAGLALVAAGTAILADTLPSASASPASPISSTSALAPAPSGTSTASASASASPASSAGPGGALTVQGPNLYDGKSGLLAQPSSVTVSQTTNLVYQTVRVSWSNFTPSSSTTYDTQASLYAVMVAECAGTDPASWSQCYGASNGGVEGSSGAAGPYNAVYDTTGPNGSGGINITIETGLENSMLSCDENHPCSLVVVPGQGGNETGYPNTKFSCGDHSQDSAVTGGYAEPSSTFSSTTGYCSWQNRIVIPLTFSGAVNGCPITSDQFSAAGSPMMSGAMLQWLTGLCQGKNPLAISYNSEIQEPQALNEAAGGLVDVALTTRSASADTADDVTMPAGRRYVYAPIAVSAAAIAYWVDSPATGQPVSGLKLDQRLVAKLLTTSYSFGDGCVAGQAPPPGIGYCDKAVSGNPYGLFQDPEFKKINPAVKPVTGQGGSYQVPTVQSGNSDITWTLTRWIAANQGADSFLGGQPDPWGMHVNTYYKGEQYPTDALLGEDPYPFIQHLFDPLYPLSEVVYHQSLNWDAGTTWQRDQYGNYDSDTPEVPGQRALFAVLDEADAAAFQFPVASVSNAAGKYVQPTAAGMAAALRDLTSDGDGTEQVNLASTDPAAYPLTMIVYAAVPTACTPPAKAKAIARFLDFAAGSGQVQGDQPGELPQGYLPLTSALRAQTRQVAAEVAGQGYSTAGCANANALPTPPAAVLPTGSLPTATKPTATKPTAAQPTATVSGTVSPASPSPAPNPPLQPVTTSVITDPQQAAGTRYVLPIALLLGGFAALAGAAALAVSGGTSFLAPLRRAGRASLPRRRRTRP